MFLILRAYSAVLHRDINSAAEFVISFFKFNFGNAAALNAKHLGPVAQN